MNSESLRVARWIEDLHNRSADAGYPNDGAVIAGDMVAADFIEELRDFLDGQAHVATRDLDPKLLPLRLPKSRLADLERCERTAVAQAAPLTEPKPLTNEMFRGAALDRFVVYQLTVGRVLDPVEVLRAMFAAGGEAELLDHMDLMEEADSTALPSMLDPLATAVADGWSGIDQVWLPRTQSRATAAFDDGRAVCSGRLDVELGGVVTGLPGVVVEVKSGEPRSEHVAEIYYYALLVALRDRRAPIAMLRWYPGAAPVIAPVSAELLESVAVRIADSMLIWAALVAGADRSGPDDSGAGDSGLDDSGAGDSGVGDAQPSEKPGAWCNWCPDADRCPSSWTTSSMIP
ncbi:MAG: hypothetical protein WBA45_12485 [Microthrixaceae bacterium]